MSVKFLEAVDHRLERCHIKDSLNNNVTCIDFVALIFERTGLHHATLAI